MADNAFVQNMLGQSRKRMVGSLMSYIEQNVYPSLKPEEQVALRQKVLNSVGVFFDTTLDLLKASVSDGFVTNELVLEAIYALHDEVKRWE